LTSALGLIETIGLPAAIAAADAAVKSANIKLLGYELTRGGGMVVVKLTGDVGAIKAAIAAGASQGKSVGEVWSTHIIARPHKETEEMVFSTFETAYPKKTAKSNKLTLVKETEKKQVEEVEEKKEEKIETPKVEGTAVKKQGEDKIGILQAEDMAIKKKRENKIETSQAEDIDALEEPTENEEDLKNKKQVCNLCKDPKCPRKKGEPKVNCIHYFKNNGG